MAGMEATAANFKAATAATDWAIFTCHSIAGGNCTCGKADCHSPGKHPRTANGLLDATSDPKQLAEWWTRWPQANLAVATGEVNGIVVIDIDPAKGGTDSMRAIEEQYEPLPETVEVETGGGGLHLYFRYPRGVKIHSKNKWRPGVDIKADGGYIIAPPSNHASGGTYRWAEGYAPGQIAIADIPEWLLPLLPQKTEATEAPRVNGSMNGHSDNLQRAQAYVAKADATSEGTRNDVAFRLAGHVAAFGLNESQTLSVLSPWNMRNNPPLPESELCQCVKSAMTNGTPRPAKEMRVDSRTWNNSGDNEPEPRAPITGYTAAELRQAFPQLNAVVIEGWGRQGETANIIANPKAGKSWLLNYLLLCLVTDRMIFERFAVCPGKCLLIDNELHGGTIAHRLDLVASEMGIARTEYEPELIIWPVRGKLPSLFDLEAEICERFASGELRAIGYDAMYRFLPGTASENDNSAMKDVYNALDRIGNHTKALNLVIHHASKGSQSDKRVTDVGAGAGAQARAADCHLILREHEQPGFAVLDAAVRSFPPMAPIALRWDFPLWQPDDSVDTAMLKGRQTASEVRQVERDQSGINKIVDALRKDGSGTARQLRGRTGLGRERQQRLLDLLQSEGQLKVSQITIRGNQCDEYALAKTGE